MIFRFSDLYSTQTYPSRPHEHLKYVGADKRPHYRIATEQLSFLAARRDRLMPRSFRPASAPGGSPMGDDRSDHPWRIASNPAFTIMLDGHFYLEDALTLDQETNLQRLLHKVSTGSVEAGLHSIRGGMYNLVILDNERQKLIVCADPSGALPLFYYHDPSGFHVSANPGSFADDLSISEMAVVEFLKYGYLPFSASIYEDVKRLLPGQIITVSLSDHQVQCSEPQVFEFKPLNHRETDLRKASERLHLALKQYFARFTPEQYLLGDDSPAAALLQFWLERKAIPHVFAAGESDTIRHEKENSVIQAQRRLILSHEYTGGFRAIATNPNDRLICDFLGSTLLGDLFFNDLQCRPLSARLGTLWQDIAWNRDIRDIPFYQNYLYHLPGALPDEALAGILQPDHEVWLLNAARGVLEVNRDAGHVHEDFLESLKIYTLGRSLLNFEPVVRNYQHLCATPFLDQEIYQACLDTDKTIRYQFRMLGYYFRNNFVNSRLPEAVQKKLSPSFFQRLATVLGWNHNSTERRRAPGNLPQAGGESSLAQIIERLPEAVSGFVADPIVKTARRQQLPPALICRLQSLADYFQF